MGPVSSTVVILFLVTSVFAVVSVHLFGQQNAANFGNSESYYMCIYNKCIYLHVIVILTSCNERHRTLPTSV